MGADGPKQYLEIDGRPMIWHALQAFERHAAICRVYVVLSDSDAYWQGYDWSGFGKLAVLRCGGATRAESVLNGLDAIADQVAEQDWLLVHDAARPCLTQALLDKLLAEVSKDAVGGILAAPIADTLKREGQDHGQRQRIHETVPRQGLWGAQTPQMFRYGLLREALRRAGSQVTDEASAIERLGLSPLLVESDASNLKVTFPHDLEVAGWWLGRRR